MSTQNLILSSLEQVAEKMGDINPEVYRRYFRSTPGAKELMDHIDHLVRGKMMEEVMRLLMLEDLSGESDYLAFEMKTHEESYSVVQSMYHSLVTTVRDVIRDGMGDDWNDQYESAWNERCRDLLDSLEAHMPSVRASG